MKSTASILVIAALSTLAACSKSDDAVTASDPAPTVTETSVDGTPTIVEDETTPAPTSVDGPAMDSIQEGMPPAQGGARKK